MNYNDIIELFNKDDKSGMLSREKYLKKNYIDAYSAVKKYSKDNNLEDLKFSQQIWHFTHNIPYKVKCANIKCNNYVKFKNRTIGYLKYCSKKCAATDIETNNKREKTNLKKYGVKNVYQSSEIKEKIQNTNLKNHGVKYISQSKEIQNKIRENSLKKYGVDHYLKSEKIKNKRINTNLKKYGVENISQIGKIKEQKKDTNLKKIGVETNLLDPNKYEDIRNKIRETCIKRYGVSTNLLINKQNVKSNFEKEISSYIKTFYNDIIIENTYSIITPYELDMYFPNINIAIEANGIYWHDERHKSKEYHYNKYLKCKEKGIKLIQIWEDEWYLKNNIIKNRLNVIFNHVTNKIYARKCYIKEINHVDYIKFLNTYHLQGSYNSKIKIGLFYNDELISVLGLGQKRIIFGSKKDKNINEYEIHRLATKFNTIVVGGVSKMIKYFIKKYNPLSIISYANLDWGEGNVYEKSGFINKGHTGISYFYNIDGIREYRYNFRKNVLVEKYNLDSTLTEVELMHKLGYYRIFTTGNNKWEWTKK